MLTLKNMKKKAKSIWHSIQPGNDAPKYQIWPLGAKQNKTKLNSEKKSILRHKIFEKY